MLNPHILTVVQVGVVKEVYPEMPNADECVQDVNWHGILFFYVIFYVIFYFIFLIIFFIGCFGSGSSGFGTQQLNNYQFPFPVPWSC